jgi:hypothetical protein
MSDDYSEQLELQIEKLETIIKRFHDIFSQLDMMEIRPHWSKVSNMVSQKSILGFLQTSPDWKLISKREIKDKTIAGYECQFSEKDKVEVIHWINPNISPKVLEYETLSQTRSIMNAFMTMWKVYMNYKKMKIMSTIVNIVESEFYYTKEL